MGGLFSLIRPLVLVDEKDFSRAARLGGFTVTSCSCDHAQASARETATEIIRLARSRGCRGVTSNLLRAVAEYRRTQASTSAGDHRPGIQPCSGVTSTTHAGRR